MYREICTTPCFYRAEQNSAEYGLYVNQAAVMHFGAAKGAFDKALNGSSIPWGTIPACPLISLSDEDPDNIVAEPEDWLQEAASRRD